MDQKVTSHRLIIGAAQDMSHIKSGAVQLVVTSPPYPMIAMWDEIMGLQNPKISEALANGQGSEAYELMHQELDKVWSEVGRILAPGGFACINIGDATRTIQEDFALYPNHSRIISGFQKLGLQNLPNIIWRKQTNAPNKFMGSGMLPAGAYVTLEHEWILIFRKGGKRTFKTDEEKLNRKKSAFFWEERNVWFSDIWDLKGTKQKINNAESRNRSAAYPFEIPYRLINMYSLYGDTVVDPFLGTGTTTLAAIAAMRNSIGYEIDPNFLNIVKDNLAQFNIAEANTSTRKRMEAHDSFINERSKDVKKNPAKHFNARLNKTVMTSQESELVLPTLDRLEPSEDNVVQAHYS